MDNIGWVDWTNWPIRVWGSGIKPFPANEKKGTEKAFSRVSAKKG
jgi:hypothetical protein